MPIDRDTDTDTDTCLFSLVFTHLLRKVCSWVLYIWGNSRWLGSTKPAWEYLHSSAVMAVIVVQTYSKEVTGGAGSEQRNTRSHLVPGEQMSDETWSEGDSITDGAVVSLYIGLLKYLAGNMALRHVGRVAPGGRIERKQSWEMKEKWDCQGTAWAKETRAGTGGKECGGDCDVVLSNWD